MQNRWKTDNAAHNITLDLRMKKLEIGKINTDWSENVLVRSYLGIILKIGTN